MCLPEALHAVGQPRYQAAYQSMRFTTKNLAAHDTHAQQTLAYMFGIQASRHAPVRSPAHEEVIDGYATEPPLGQQAPLPEGCQVQGS